MRLIVIMFAGLMVVSYTQAEIFTYKDAEGNVVFSDVAVKGAKAVKVPPVMTYQSTLPNSAKSANLPSQTQPSHKPYQRLTILVPEQEATIRNNQGEVTIRYSVSPVLQKGDSVQVFLDGELEEGLVLKGLDRGEHTIRLQVVDGNGYAHVTSDDVVFYLRHQSKINPIAKTKAK